MKIQTMLGAPALALNLLIATASLQCATAQAAEANAPAADATLSLSGGSIAAGVGYTWGSGALNLGGVNHKVKISGLSIVDIGAAKISAAGRVYNLKNLSDFDGTYTTFSAGATIAGGGGVAYLRNQNGVVIRLDSTTEGLRFNLSASGVTLKIQS